MEAVTTIHDNTHIPARRWKFDLESRKSPMAEKIKQVKPEDLVGPLKTSSIIQRHPLNPIFTSENVPYPSVIAYNAGVVKYQGQYVMVFPNDYNWNDEEQKAIGFQIGVAYSEDGISNWRVHPKPIIEFQGGPAIIGAMESGSALVVLAHAEADLGDMLYLIRRYRPAVTDAL